LPWLVSPSPVKSKAPAAQPAPKKPSPIGPIVADIVARSKAIVADIVPRSKAIVDAVHARAAAVPLDRRTLSIAAIAVLVVIVAVIVAVTGVPMFSGPAPTGAVVIDAVPWGSITAIEAQDGSAVALPPSPSTPLSLTLPEGTYNVVVTGPPPELQTQRITVVIQRDAATVAPLVRFRALTAEDYFEQYLEKPAAPTPDPGVPPAESTPASPNQSSPVPSPATGSTP
jgi:hypothetical protein